MQRKKWVVPVVGMCVFLSQAKSEQVMYGNIQLEDTIVNKDIKVLGRGSADRTRFEKDVTVYGMLNASDSQFMGDLRVNGSDVELVSDQVAGDVHISNYIRTPKLKLKDTVIQGKVIFHGLKQGKVILDKASKIIKGVENGVCYD